MKCVSPNSGLLLQVTRGVLLQGKSASAVISNFRTVFARHGMPEILVADNMPFDSSEIRQYAVEYGFAINPSSTEHAAFNGQSERMIGTVKQLT